MSSGPAILLSRLVVTTEAISRRDRIVLCLIATLHLVALIMMVATEADLVAKAAFLLVWAALNFFWLALVCRERLSVLATPWTRGGLLTHQAFQSEVIGKAAINARGVLG
jgi:hypothetical protein